MKLTKYEHACVVIEDQEDKLVIDPGMFADLPDNLQQVKAVIITHDHGDHYTDENLKKIQAVNPDVMFFTTTELASKLDGSKPVEPGQEVQVGVFKLKFFGGQHQQVHPDYPGIANIGVLVSGKIYYPGDSFAMTDTAVDTLLVPAAAPWMKTAEAMNFISAVKPRLAIPTHDAVLSDQGNGFTDNWLKQAAEKAGSTYRRLNPAESTDI